MFWSRAQSLRGCALALKKAAGPHTATGDIYLAYGYMFQTNKLVRIVYAPAVSIREAFFVEEGDGEFKYKRAKSQAMVEVSKLCG